MALSVNMVSGGLTLGAAALAGCSLAVLVAPRSVRRSGWTPLEFLATTGLATVALLMFAGVALGRAGLFSPVALTVVLLLLAVAFACAGLLTRGPSNRLPGPQWRDPWELLALALAVAVCAFGVTRRFDEVEGLRDPGVYAATGIELARTGDFGWRDPLTARVGLTETRRYLVDWGGFHQGKPELERFPGFAVYNKATGDVRPQFLGGYEVLLATAHAIAGPQATQCVNAVLAALSLLVFFCAMRILSTPAAAGMSAVLLAVNPLQAWYARFTSNEMLTQLLLWGFVFLFMRSCCDPRMPVSPSARRRPFQFGLLLLASAVLVKFASWLLLPFAGFLASLAASRGRLPVRRRVLLLAMPLLALGAWLHARLFAHFYLFGTWSFSLGRAGIPFSFFPILFVAVTAAAVSAGALAEPLARRMARWWGRPRFRGALVAGIGLIVLLALFWQMRAARAAAAADAWHEKTNLVEFASYFTLAGFVAGLAGLLYLAWRESPRRTGMFLALLAGSAFFLWQRRLDAVHPWGARRWVPFLVPAWCGGVGYLTGCVWERWGRLGRLMAPALTGALAIATASTAPAMMKVRNHRGLIAGMDRLVSHLRSDDLVFVQPTAALDQFSPYLKARFDVDLYVHPYGKGQWAASRDLMGRAAAAGKRVLYVTDRELTAPLESPGFLSLHWKGSVDYPSLVEELHRVPSRVAQVHVPVLIYQLNPKVFPSGWHPQWKPPAAGRKPAEPPVELRFDAEAEPFLDGFLDPSPFPNGAWFRWTNGWGKIRIGALLQFPLKAKKLRLVVRMGSYRQGEFAKMPVDCFLDPMRKDRAANLGRVEIGSSLRDVAIEVDAALVHPDTVFELWSRRPPVGTIQPLGQLGITVEQIRIEAVE